MENKEIDFELLLKLDLDIYTEWVLKRKSVTRQKKKEMVLRLMGIREKTISNYKSSIEEVFIKTKYWKEPSEDEKVFFSEWRKSEFEQEVDFYNYLTEGNPLPFDEIKKLETKRIVNKLNSLYSHLIPYIINRWLTEEYFELACFTGTIDYLKWLYREEQGTDSGSPIKQDNGRTLSLIVKRFNEMDSDGYKYAFQDEKDFQKFTYLLVCFFDGIKYELPKQKIRLKIDTMSRVAKTLKDIYRDQCTKTLRTNNEYFNLIRVLNHFDGKADDELYKSLTK